MRKEEEVKNEGEERERKTRIKKKSQLPAGGSYVIFTFTTAPRPALEPIQSPIQRVPGVMRPGREADHSPPSSVEVKE